MSEPKFTPGPWHYDKDNHAIYNKNCLFICVAPVNNEHDIPLIAAAPELYFWGDLLVREFEEAQSLFMAMLLENRPKEEIEDQAELNRLAIQNMKAALKKARGEG